MKMFPIVFQGPRYKDHGLREIPWEMIAQFEKQAIKNHDQDLKELARLGGLCIEEVWLVIFEKPLSDFWRINWDKINAVADVKARIVCFTSQGEELDEKIQTSPY